MKRSTLIVVSLFIVLLAAALMLSKKPAQRGGQELDLSSLTPETLSGITVKAPESEKAVTLRKEGETWKLADGHLADPEAVQRALDAIGEIRTTDLVSTSAARREKYGVGDKKALRIELQRQDATPVVLLLGSSAKGGGYIRRDGTNAIFKLKRNISYLFPSESKRWLKLKLFDAAIEDLKGVKIALKGETPYELIPGDDEAEWKLKDDSILPGDFRFDGKAARALVQQALSCRATEIVDELPEGTDAGLDADQISLELEKGSVTLHLGALAGKNLVWARVDGRDPFFKIPEYQAKNLRKKVEDLRDLHLMSFEKEKISDLRIEAGKTAIHLHKGDDGSWSIDEKLSKPPKDFQFDPAMVEGFISSLESLRAETFIGPKPGAKTGLDHPTVRIDLEAAGNTPVQLLVGAEFKGGEGSPGGYYAQGNADDAVYVIPAFQKKRLERGWELFRKINRPPGGGMGNIDPETLAKLPPEVRRQLLQQMQQQQLRNSTH